MAQSKAIGTQGCGWLVAVGVALFAIAKCAGPSATPTAPDPTATAAVSTPGYVAARSLRCRNEPTSTGAVQASFTHGAPVTIIKRAGDWSQLSRPNGDCWVATAFLSDGEPSGNDGRSAASGTTSQSGNDHAGSTRTAASTAQGFAAVGVGTTGATLRARHRMATHRTHTGYRRPTRSRTPRSHSYFYDDGACPCSGSHICIGPRGGRYCITSGGNKRYGV